MFHHFCIFLRVYSEPKEEAKPEINDKFWELLLSAEKKDYENICAQYGITDFRWMLKKLNEKKLEREQEQEKVCFHVTGLCKAASHPGINNVFFLTPS